MIHDIKCGICSKKLGEVSNPININKAVDGFYCGQVIEKSSCARKWFDDLNVKEKLKFADKDELMRKFVLDLLKEKKLIK